MIVTTPGVITLFDNAVVYGDPLDAFSYYENKRGRKKKFGDFRGFIIGEVIRGDCRLHYEFIRPDPKVEARRRRKRFLRKKGVPIWYYDKYLKRNTLRKWFPRARTREI